MNKKTWIFLGVIVLFIVGIIVIYNVTKTKDLISKEKTVQGIKFSNAKLTKLSDKYIFNVTVTTSKEAVKVIDFDATVYDKKGNRLETLTGYIGDIDNLSRKDITIECKEDLSEAYEINYTIRINND
jgi:hypothetical protein